MMIAVLSGRKKHLTVVMTTMLEVVDGYDLVDPSDEGGDLDVHAGDVLTSTAEAPGHQATQLVVAVYVAH